MGVLVGTAVAVGVGVGGGGGRFGKVSVRLGVSSGTNPTDSAASTTPSKWNVTELPTRAGSSTLIVSPLNVPFVTGTGSDS